MARLNRIIPWYRRLVQLYPNPFRTHNGEEMVSLFAESWRDLESATPAARRRYVGLVVRDGLATLLREWEKALSWQAKVLLMGIIAIAGLEYELSDFRSLAQVAFVFGSMWLAQIVFGLRIARRPAVGAIVALLLAPVLFLAGKLPNAIHATHSLHGFTIIDGAFFAMMPFVLLLRLRAKSIDPAMRDAANPARSRISLATALAMTCFISAMAGMLIFREPHGSGNTVYLLLPILALSSYVRDAWRGVKSA